MNSSATKTCEARHQGGNEYRCNRCNFTWDADDPEPPECLTDVQINRRRGHRYILQMKKGLNHETE